MTSSNSGTTSNSVNRDSSGVSNDGTNGRYLRTVHQSTPSSAAISS